jgi:hypothetical protein
MVDDMILDSEVANDATEAHASTANNNVCEPSEKATSHEAKDTDIDWLGSPASKQPRPARLPVWDPRQRQPGQKTTKRRMRWKLSYIIITTKPKGKEMETKFCRSVAVRALARNTIPESRDSAVS